MNFDGIFLGGFEKKNRKKRLGQIQKIKGSSFKNDLPRSVNFHQRSVALSVPPEISVAAARYQRGFSEATFQGQLINRGEVVIEFLQKAFPGIKHNGVQRIQYVQLRGDSPATFLRLR